MNKHPGHRTYLSIYKHEYTNNKRLRNLKGFYRQQYVTYSKAEWIKFRACDLLIWVTIFM